MWRRATSALAGVLLLALGGAAGAEVGELRVEIYEPAEGRVLEDSPASLEVEGGASIFGGVRYLDLVFVLDRSKSLLRTDPEDFRAAGAIGLVENLSPTRDIRIGVVAVDWDAELLVPLTTDRARVLAGLRDLDRRGGTDLAAGLREAVQSFEIDSRPDATRVVLLFTDGKSDDDEAREAMAEARERGVVIHTLALGSNRDGRHLLAEIAQGTGGSFVPVTDPAKLPEAFLDLRTTGVDHVTLSANGSEPRPARLLGGRFQGEVPLREGENRIVARAVALDGRTREHVIRVLVRAPGCGELSVEARHDGETAISLSDRAVEVVLDASNSMWGQLAGRPKISVAQQTLRDALEWLPEDLQLGLRVYGHRKKYSERDCRDSELLAAPGPDNRGTIRGAIEGLIPRGQTPLAFSIDQVAADFGSFRGERAVVLVTDGIESCGGDPVEAARRLQEGGRLPIHVIGFGLGRRADEDETQLRGIAEASGGRFLTAGNAEELREALAVTVGTAFRVFQGEDWVASGALGAGDRILLPPGDYVVRLETTPPIEAPVSLASEESRILTVVKEQDRFSAIQVKRPAPYASCEGSFARASQPAGGAQPAATAWPDEIGSQPAAASLEDTASPPSTAAWPEETAPRSDTAAWPEEPAPQPTAAAWPEETASRSDTAAWPEEPASPPSTAAWPQETAPQPAVPWLHEGTAQPTAAPPEPSLPSFAAPPPPAQEPAAQVEHEAGGALEPAPPAAVEPEGFDASEAPVASTALNDLRGAPVAEESAPEAEERPWLALAAGDGTIEVWEDRQRSEPWLVVVTHPRLAGGAATVWTGHDAEVARQVAQAVRETLRELSLR